MYLLRSLRGCVPNLCNQNLRNQDAHLYYAPIFSIKSYNCACIIRLSEVRASVFLLNYEVKFRTSPCSRSFAECTCSTHAVICFRCLLRTRLRICNIRVTSFKDGLPSDRRSSSTRCGSVLCWITFLVITTVLLSRASTRDSIASFVNSLSFVFDATASWTMFPTTM
jgi:hypothetical protein